MLNFLAVPTPNSTSLPTHHEASSPELNQLPNLHREWPVRLTPREWFGRCTQGSTVLGGMLLRFVHPQSYAWSTGTYHYALSITDFLRGTRFTDISMRLPCGKTMLPTQRSLNTFTTPIATSLL